MSWNFLFEQEFQKYKVGNKWFLQTKELEEFIIK